MGEFQNLGNIVHKALSCMLPHQTVVDVHTHCRVSMEDLSGGKIHLEVGEHQCSLQVLQAPTGWFLNVYKMAPLVLFFRNTGVPYCPLI